MITNPQQIADNIKRIKGEVTVLKLKVNVLDKKEFLSRLSKIEVFLDDIVRILKDDKDIRDTE